VHSDDGDLRKDGRPTGRDLNTSARRKSANTPKYPRIDQSNRSSRLYNISVSSAEEAG